MNARVEELFHDVVDLSLEARAQYFAEHGVDDATRREVEDLAAFDSYIDTSITRDIGNAADRMAMGVEPTHRQCGPYRLLELLGRGGMGAVYLAERVDGEVKQRVAVKLLRPGGDGATLRKRFLAERQFLATLHHRGIARLLDAGHMEDGQPYLVMDYIDGTPIDAYAAGLEVRGKLALFLRVCDAVSYAHQNLIVHRDIKPSNIIVDTAGEPKLLDFGIAKLLEDQDGQNTLTRGGGALTPEYAAPEQVTGGAVTTATDVYALGVLLYVLLTGRHPAATCLHSYADLLKAIVDIEPPRLSDAAGFPRGGTGGANGQKQHRLFRGDLDTIVAKALKKNPKDRYCSVASFAEDVRRHLRFEPIAARPDAFVYRTTRFVLRHRTAVALGSLVLIASAAGAVGTWSQAQTAREQRDFALRQLSRADAINDLNSFVLSDAAPLGKPFTVKELLARAEQIVQRRQGEGDSGRVDLLISIGRQYYAMDDDGGSKRVLEAAYRLSRKLPEPSTRAQAACALGSTLARSGDFTRAEALIQEGLREVSSQSQFVLDRAFCLQRGSEVARGRGASREAVVRAQEGQQLLKQLPFQPDLRDLHALMGQASSETLGRAYLEFGRDLQAQGRDDEARANLWLAAEHLRIALGTDHPDARSALHAAQMLNSEAGQAGTD